MYYSKFTKTTAQLVLAVFIAVSTLNTNTLAQANEPTCVQTIGGFYIVTELVKTCGFLNLACTSLGQVQSYVSEEACVRGAIEKYGCIPATQDKIFYGTRSSQAFQVNFSENEVSVGEAYACLSERSNSRIENRQPDYGQVGSYCTENTKFFQCKCSKTLVGSSGVIGEIINWSNGNSNYSCFMKEVSTPQLVESPKTKILSPFALFKTITDLLFMIGILVFIMNIMRIGLVYIRSGGIPDNLKAARTLLNNTIGGMIFLILVSGLIAYTNNAFTF